MGGSPLPGGGYSGRVKTLPYEWVTIPGKNNRGSDPTAAGGGGREGSEWQRSIADEGFEKPRKISGTATGNEYRR